MAGPFPEALVEFEIVTDLAPDLADAYSNWGQVLRLMGDELGAIARFEQALERAPGHPDASRHLARLRASLDSSD